MEHSYLHFHFIAGYIGGLSRCIEITCKVVNERKDYPELSAHLLNMKSQSNNLLQRAVQIADRLKANNNNISLVDIQSDYYDCVEAFKVILHDLNDKMQKIEKIIEFQENNEILEVLKLLKRLTSSDLGWRE